MEHFFLDLHLTVTGGSFSTVGELHLYCWLRAVQLPGTASAGNLVTVRPSAATGELEVSESAVEARRAAPLVSLLEDLRFPAQRPLVEDVFDTSDFWQHVIFRVTLNDDSDAVELALCSSGFEGEDAAGLRAVFRGVLEIAGVTDQRCWHNLAGRRQAGAGEQGERP